MKRIVKTPLKIACLTILTIALAGRIWWGNQQLHRGTSIDSASRTGEAVGAGPQPAAKAVLASQVQQPTPTVTAAESEPAPAMPERLRLILNSDRTTSFRERIRSLHTINRHLMIEECNALFRYLRTPANNMASRNAENWLRNDIMDLLAEQPALPLGYPDVLIAIYNDPSQDAVMRDYALQHIPLVYDRANTDEKVGLTNVLWQAVGETDSSIAGTSLLTLLQLTSANPPVDQNQVADAALKLAADGHTGELSRITAVQVCGRIQVEQALPVVEQMAQDGPTIPLRISATAALGDYAVKASPSGSADIIALLSQMVASSEPRQALAAQSALNRVQHARATTASFMGQQTSQQVTQ
jgi:hypothetical protein